MNPINKFQKKNLKLNTDFFKNSFWGVFSNVIQNILFSFFFIVVARKYNSQDFGSYIIANTLYGFILTFSSLGLGQWFIRELVVVVNKEILIAKFFKIQFFIGILFYVLNILICYLLYDNALIRNLSILIGVNLIFDNIIYVISYINIANFEQKKSFIIVSIEAFLKFLVACLILYTHFTIIYLSFILIFLRFITLNLFIQVGISGNINLKDILFSKFDILDLKKIVFSNWPFIVIGSISVLFWRIGNIFVSKNLNISEVTNYEISFKLFSLAQILPFIIASSIFPILSKKIKKNVSNAIYFYKKAFFFYTFFGLITYTFIFSFSDIFIPILFGHKYISTPKHCVEMFLTILVFPTALLQANLLVAMNQEKKDMQFNIISLFVNILFCTIGFNFFKTLSVVNYSIFFSFLVFHILQDITLLKQKIINIQHVLSFYLFSITIILLYNTFYLYFNKYLFFIIFWFIFSLLFIFYYMKYFSFKISFKNHNFQL